MNFHSDDRRPMEREMSRQQRGLVDACFDESQYDSAITVLEQIRSPNYRPSASHIRQLLYLALYPPPPAINDKGKERIVDPVSPSKAAKAASNYFILTPSVTAAAQRLLTSFANINTPGALFRAFPSSSESNGIYSGDDDDDSDIAKEATCIKEAKFCWNILKEGFVQPKRVVPSTPKKSRSRRRIQDEDDVILGDASGVAGAAVVAENAWPVLDWLVGIFERDESLTGNNSSPRYSPLLLSQIPAPRSGMGPRWEVDVPLNIIFHCFQQEDEKRISIGARLMTLLINLSSSANLDTPMFIYAVLTHLLASTSHIFSIMFSHLPPSAAISRFKVSLCHKYIVDTAISHNPSQLGPRPRPQARAQPRAIREEESIAKPINSSIAGKQTVIPSSEILRLMKMDLGTSSVLPIASSLRIKFELLVAYRNLQKQVSAEEQDTEWPALVNSPNFRHVVNNAFSHDDDGMGQVYRETLEAICFS